MLFNKVQHVAIIVSNLERSRDFYIEKLGFKVLYEIDMPERHAKFLYLDAKNIIVELCYFPAPPKRLAWPEAAGLRHICFEVENFDETIEKLNEKGIETEHIRKDSKSGKRLTFFKDPDGLPIEIQEK